MKKLMTIIALLTSQLSFATIANSQLETRHLELIEQAVKDQCGRVSALEQTALKKEIIKIDQGINDVKYSVALTGLIRLDQNIFDRYTIKVESEYADMYDHETHNWGQYQVTSVSCVQD